MKNSKQAMLALVATSVFFLGTFVQAQEITPVGVWKSVDEKSGKETSHVQIWKNSNGVIYGKILKLLNEPNGSTFVCSKCTDDRAGKKVEGLEILRDFKQKNASDPYFWDQGTVLDPDNGKVYKSYIKISEDNKKMILRGYIGVPAFGRSQTWYRVK